MFRLMGGMWLMHLVHQVEALGETTDGGSDHELQIPWDAWSHHNTFTHSAAYRSQLYRLISGDRRVIRVPKSCEVVRVAPNKPDWRRQAVEGMLRLAQLPRAEVMICRPYLKIPTPQRLVAAVRTFRQLSWNDLDIELYSAVTPNLQLRLALADDADSLEPEDVIRRLLPLTMPLGYAEALPDVQTRLHSLCPPRLLYSANANQMHLPFQIASAMWSGKGATVVSHQHGGHQGLDVAHAGEEYEARASHLHYTFGWSDHRSNVRPLVTAPPAVNSLMKSDRLLLMTLADSDSTYRLQPFCTPDHVQVVARETRQFLSDLTWSADVVIRGSHSDVEVLQTKYFTRIDDLSISGATSASCAALTVHNYLGMSWLETLALDIPTVCFIPTGIHKFRAAAQPFADALIRVGVLHYSGSEAAKFVNSLRGDPTAWWQSAEVQEAREAFVARYANFSDNWLEAWTEEFERLLS
jgi:putative transferase (TIGR04331 family)